MIWAAIALTTAGSMMAQAPATGGIEGQLLDPNGRAAYAGNAAVFLCDAETGLPLIAASKKRFVPGETRVRSFRDFYHAITTDKGSFSFTDVPVGSYRLVAQSWSGTEGIPDFSEQPSTVVTLHGSAEKVQVKADEVTKAHPRQLGTSVLKIVNDPEENHAFLLISLKPRLGDGVLGPGAWGKEFISSLIGVTQMERHYVTLVGLPNQTDIHVGLFNYDNNPGVGGDTYRVGKENTVRLKIFATWSNGKYNPPQRLLKLTDHLDEAKLSAAQLLGLKGNYRENAESLGNLLKTEPRRVIEVEGVGKFTLADVLAAEAYKKLRKFHRSAGRK